MLAEAGINFNSCFVTNCFSIHPPRNETWRLFETNQTAKTTGLRPHRGLYPLSSTLSELQRLNQQLGAVRPTLVIAAGNYALWALTEHASISSLSLGNGVTVNVPSGIMSWRGSMVYSGTTEHPSLDGAYLLPILHPAAVLRAWYQRSVVVHDLRTRTPLALKSDWRTANEVIYAPPIFDAAHEQLTTWLHRLNNEKMRLVVDIETARQLITCMGFADSSTSAMVIPFVRLEPDKSFSSFWSHEQELALVTLIRHILIHPNLLLEGQNFIYDTQYIRRELGVIPRLDFDTMLAHHLLFPGTPKGLDYLASLYCKYHWYWKDEAKEWDLKLHGFQQLLAYNAIDVMRTFECATELRRIIAENGLTEQWEWERRKADLALRMMLRGIAVDRPRRARIGFELLTAQNDIHATLEQIAPGDIAREVVKTSKAPWYSSAKQTQFLFYDILGLPVQKHKKSKNPTVDDEALTTLRKKAPQFELIFKLLADERSIGVFNSTFVAAPLDHDGRMRCSFNPAGTETFRWSSSANAFGGGTNLQNIPKGEED